MTASETRKALHDLRNALGALVMNLELAADPDSAPDEMREAVADALSCAETLETKLRSFREPCIEFADAP